MPSTVRSCVLDRPLDQSLGLESVQGLVQRAAIHATIRALVELFEDREGVSILTSLQDGEKDELFELAKRLRHA
jgi:hypothetical protein